MFARLRKWYFSLCGVNKSWDQHPIEIINKNAIQRSNFQSFIQFSRISFFNCYILLSKFPLKWKSYNSPEIMNMTWHVSLLWIQVIDTSKLLVPVSRKTSCYSNRFFNPWRASSSNCIIIIFLSHFSCLFYCTISCQVASCKFA